MAKYPPVFLCLYVCYYTIYIASSKLMLKVILPSSLGRQLHIIGEACISIATVNLLYRIVR